MPSRCLPCNALSLFPSCQYCMAPYQIATVGPHSHAHAMKLEPSEVVTTQQVPLTSSRDFIPAKNCIVLCNLLLATAPDACVAQTSKKRPRLIVFENNYKHRNVYKSIIRRMSALIQEKKAHLQGFLRKVGFNDGDIEDGFVKVIGCKDTERMSGNKKMGPQLINDAVDDKTVFTYLLKETLENMLKDWDENKIGKVAKKNIETYRKVCMVYYEKVKTLLKKE